MNAEILNKINEKINEYEMLQHTDPNRLSVLRGELAQLSYSLGEVVNDAHKAYLNAQYTRKKQKSLFTVEELKKENSVSKSEKEADVKTLPYLSKELNAQGEYEGLRRSLNQLGEILSAMQQRISVLGKEMYNTKQDS